MNFMNKGKEALLLCLILLVAPLAGCLDLNEGSQGDEGVTESCVDFDYSDLVPMQIVSK